MTEPDTPHQPPDPAPLLPCDDTGLTLQITADTVCCSINRCFNENLHCIMYPACSSANRWISSYYPSHHWCTISLWICRRTYKRGHKYIQRKSTWRIVFGPSFRQGIQHDSHFPLRVFTGKRFVLSLSLSLYLSIYLSNSISISVYLSLYLTFLFPDLGPRMARILRDRDRKMNPNQWPTTHYPQVYVLKGGYKNFWTLYHQYDVCVLFFLNSSKSHHFCSSFILLFFSLSLFHIFSLQFTLSLLPLLYFPQLHIPAVWTNSHVYPYARSPVFWVMQTLWFRKASFPWVPLSHWSSRPSPPSLPVQYRS